MRIMKNLKILITHASAGGGHKSAALAVEKALAEKYPQMIVNTIDALDYTNSQYKHFYISAYLNMVKRMPELWGYLYRTYDITKITPQIEKLRKQIDKINARKLVKFVLSFAPDIIISTHFLPLQIISNMKAEGTVTAPLTGILTDYCAHSMWMHNNVDLYFTATEDVKRELHRLGQPEDKIVVSGIPVNPAFRNRIDKKKARINLGLEKNKHTLLLLAGGCGVGPITNVVSSFCAEKIDVQIIVVCGSNEKLLKQIQKITEGRSDFKVYGFTNNVADLMSASDLIITKPGGLSCAELLAKERPVVIFDPIPGQEQRNCEYLLQHGAGIRLYDPSDAPYLISKLLNDKSRFREMEKNAAKISKPNAAFDIIENILYKYK